MTGLDPQELLMTMRNGKSVFSRAVRMMTDCSIRAMEQAGVTAANIDRFIPHQANARIFEAVCENIGMASRKTVRTIEEFGNSSAATATTETRLRMAALASKNLLAALAGRRPPNLVNLDAFGGEFRFTS